MAASPLNVQRILSQIDLMKPPDQLRLAASLLEAERPATEIAHAIVNKVSDELGAALTLARMKKA